jgi:PTS system fructose-specific IIC component
MDKNEIKLSLLLKEKYIDLDLKADSKKKLLLEFVGCVSKAAGIKDRKAFLSAILKRERLGSTGIGNGVAIPHAKSKKINKFILAFARKNEGIDFGALDGAKTYIFFMLGSPEEKVGEHLKILSEISQLAKDKFVVELFKKAKNKKEILNIISTYEA